MEINTRLKPAFLMLALSLSLAVPATASIAAGSDWMNDYFNSAGAAMNVTPSAVYESQGQTTMALGGFSYRAPQRATNLFSFSPPGYKAGCGGIDAWAGAYGFVNADAFVAALRNIGQNAIGYFFQLALKTMAPEIDGLLTDLSKTINGLNQMQVNSCQMIKQYVGTVPDTMNMDLENRAKTFGSALTGTFGDYFSANEKTKTSPTEVNKAIDDACTATATLCRDSAGNMVLKSEFNLVYDALERAGGYSKEEIELYISLFGTVTFLRNGSDTASKFTPEYFKPTLVWQDFTGPQTAPLNLKIRECPSVAGCLPYASATDTGTIRVTTGMTAIVYENLNKLRDAIVTRSPMTDPKVFQLVAMTATPIYQMIAQAIHAGRGSTIVADRIIDGFSEVIATEIAFRQMEDISRAVDEALRKVKAATIKGEEKAIEDFQKSLRATKEDANTAYAAQQAAAAQKMESVAAMIGLQRQLYASLGPRLTSNIEFGKR